MRASIISTMVITAGILLFVLGYYLAVHNITLFSRMLHKQMVLSKNSKSYDFWKDTSNLPPMHLDLYFFNWTNPEDLTDPDVKPNLVQVGPYSFREIRKKVNITFHPENNTVSYFLRRFWYFDQERSNGTLQDYVIQLDAVAAAAAYKIRNWSYFMQNTFSYLLSSKSDLSIKKTVDEFLFTGYEDTLINMGKIAVSQEMPPFDRFGWFYMRNGSIDYDGNFNMDTGSEDINQLGVLRKWNYKDTTTFYKTPCNIIEGSAGEFWPPHQIEDDITLFNSDLCRPLTYEFEKKINYMGIQGNKYILGGKSLGNNTKKRYPHDQAKYFEITTTTENFFESDYSAETTISNNEDPDVVNLGNCYCNGECYPNGLINISSCRYETPIFVSLPHFYKADPMLANQVVGLNPNEEDHSFYIVLEPTTGIPLEVAARLQINMLIQSSPIISLFKDIPRIYFPIIWFSMKVKIPEKFVSDLKSLFILKDLMSWTGIFLIPIGIIMIFSTLVYLYFRRNTSGVHEQLKMENSNDSSKKNEESVYLNKLNPDEDTHIRNNRQLYPKLY